MNDPVLLDIENHIATITLNRPDQLNAFSDPEMINGFLEVLDRIEAHEEVRVAILTGAGRAFSAGGNVKHMRDKTDMFAGSPVQIEKAYLEGILRVPPRFYALDIPIIAAVNGAAFGAALDLVCMCDFRLASENASFGAPFVKIGLAPGDGAAWFLPRVIGQERAAEMLFTSDTVDAKKAKDIGLVSEVHLSDELMPAAMSLATRIAKNAPLAIKATKQLMRQASLPELREHLKDCARIQGNLHQTDDHAEAIEAFFEKRTGRFEGR